MSTPNSVTQKKPVVAIENTKKRRRPVDFTPYMLLIPWFIGMAVFRVYPIFQSAWISTRRYHPILGDMGSVGLSHYRTLFGYNVFRDSFFATMRYVLIGTPTVLVTAFFVAFILNFKLKGVNLFRTAYYVPSILGGNVAVAILWGQLFRGAGPINTVLDAIGIGAQMWLTDPNFMPFTLIFLSAWQFGSVMLIFLAALQSVSPTLYEAASIDGARKWRQLFTITLPLITPMLLFNAVNVLLRHFQEFNAAFLIPPTPGGPLRATYFLNLMIYDYAFRFHRYDFASALTWIFLGIIGIISVILFTSSKYWVHNSD